MTEQHQRLLPPARTGPDVSHVHHTQRTPEETHDQPFDNRTAGAERRRRQGPPAATRSGYARALTPTPDFGVPGTYGESQRKTSRTP